MPSENRKRLDLFLFESGLTDSRQRAKALIMAGKVRVNGKPAEKAGMVVSTDDQVSVQEDIPFVSRGGFKLLEALQRLPLTVNGWICMDIGASTGGFTDCLLQHGAREVYAVDVGYGQLAWKLRQDPRVRVIERTNIRNLPAESIPYPMDLITIDVSFISLQIVVPAALKFLKPDGMILPLIKPQFEVGKDKVGRGGVVKDPKLHETVIAKLSIFFQGLGLKPLDVIPSPILGPKGNKEFILPLRWTVCS